MINYQLSPKQQQEAQALIRDCQDDLYEIGRAVRARLESEPGLTPRDRRELEAVLRICDRSGRPMTG